MVLNQRTRVNNVILISDIYVNTYFIYFYYIHFYYITTKLFLLLVHNVCLLNQLKFSLQFKALA